MDAFELLKTDHKKVAELFDLLETASGKRKLDVFKRIKSELEVHTHIEETIFYPALEKPEPTHDLTLEAFEEHKVVKTLLAELSGAKSATDEWQAKAKVLRENVEHHVNEEENELFDKAEDVLSDEEIEALGERMEAEKARKLGQPVPKKTAPRKNSSDEPGILAKIANLVGLGNKNKKTTKKAPAKAAAKKKSTAATKSTKASKATKATKATKARKTAQAPSKSASAKLSKQASKANSTAAKKRSPVSAAKKASKKRANKK
jgi:hemerythrin-like domain-containing protein